MSKMIENLKIVEDFLIELYHKNEKILKDLREKLENKKKSK